MSDFLMEDPEPMRSLALLTRAEMLDRLNGVVNLHWAGAGPRCVSCGEPFPCSTLVVAVGTSWEDRR